MVYLLHRLVYICLLIETKARLDHYDEDFQNTDSSTKKLAKNKSNLRYRNTEILADSDKKYAGKRVSRKDLEEDSGEENSENEDEDSDEDATEEDDDGHIQEFLSMMKAKSSSAQGLKKKQLSDEDEDDEADSDNEDFLDDESNQDSENASFEIEGEEEEDENEDGEGESKDGNESGIDEEDMDDENTEAGGAKQSFSSEVEKGKAIQSQLSLWDHLLECRIKLHKGIHLANQLPQGPSSFKAFIKAGDSHLTTAAQEVQTALKTLLDSFLELQVSTWHMEC